jgi:hypothetical protein
MLGTLDLTFHVSATVTSRALDPAPMPAGHVPPH